MKLKAQVLIDADPDSVWQIFNRSDVIAEHVGTVTEAREPDLIMGLWQGERSSAVVVNHFESINERQTRWVAYWNFTLQGVRKLKAVLGARGMERDLQDRMERFKLRIETELQQHSGRHDVT